MRSIDQGFGVWGLGFVDGASAGVIIYLSNTHSISIKAGLKNGTNNLAEMMALKLTLTLTAEHELPKLRYLGLPVSNQMN